MAADASRSGCRLSAARMAALFCLALYHAGGAAGAADPRLLREGDAAAARGEFTAALRAYSAALEADPTAALLYVKRAGAQRGLGAHAAALRDLGRAIELEPLQLQGWLHRGRLLRSTCSFGRAESDFRHILSMRPDHKTALAELDTIRKAQAALEGARQARAGGDVAGARRQLGEVFSAAPECSDARLLEAHLLLAERDYGGVVAVTGQVLKGEPGRVEALALRARAYLLLGDTAMSKRHYGEALRYDPDHAASKADFRQVKDLEKKSARAAAAAGAERWAEAEAEYVAALQVEPAAAVLNTALWLGLCKARLALRRGAAAREACAGALALDDGLVEAAVLQVKALIVEENFEAAVREAQALRQRLGNNQEVLQVLATAEKALKMAQRKDWYQVLGVERSASQAEIKRAYRDLARRYHPDKAAQANLSKEEAEAKFTDLAAAYEILSDEEKRTAWDRGDDVVPQQQGHPGFQGFHGGFQGGHAFHFQWG